MVLAWTTLVFDEVAFQVDAGISNAAVYREEARAVAAGSLNQPSILRVLVILINHVLRLLLEFWNPLRGLPVEVHCYIMTSLVRRARVL